MRLADLKVKVWDVGALQRELDALQRSPSGDDLIAKAAFIAARHVAHKTAAELTKLLERVEQLEQAPLAYDGPHEVGKTYRKGTFVTRDGSLWHANYTTASRPGDGPAWTLAVKRGRDAR